MSPIKKILSLDGKHYVEIISLDNGMFQFIETSQQLDKGDEYQYPFFYMMPTHWSGLYDTAESAERDARLSLHWLRD